MKLSNALDLLLDCIAGLSAWVAAAYYAWHDMPLLVVMLLILAYSIENVVLRKTNRLKDVGAWPAKD